ncbi:type VII secretion protein EccE [Amycolatopsis sp. NPDC059027]|uniref:type VII secretion protein EccE n=1 Tax=Amycolatopsis sp. NPDC059027 TaxID=3346709 RepID=UPI003670476E
MTDRGAATELGAARPDRRGGAPAPPRPQAMSVQPGTAYGTISVAESASRAAAREAARAALSAARQPQARVATPIAAPSPPPAGPRKASAPPKSGDRRVASRTGGIGVGQLVCWQLVLVALVLAVGRPWPVLAAVVVVAAVVVTLTAVRFHGRWLYAWLAVGSGYLLRERVRDLRSESEAGRALLHLISPEAAGSTDEDGAFLLSRAAGITAVLQPKSAVRDLTKAMPAPESLLPPPHEQAQAIAAQVVHHAGISRDRPPRVWVTLQAVRTVDVHHDTDVRRALRNALRRVQRQLRRGGLPARALAEHEVLGTLASLAHVTAGRGQVREEWRGWHSGPITQATFRLDGWAELSPAVAPQMVRWLLAAVPQAAVTVAVTAYRPAGAAVARTDAAVRIAATGSPALEHAARELARLAGEWGLGMERLDGRHAWGMAATLPIGVTERTARSR